MDPPQSLEITPRRVSIDHFDHNGMAALERTLSRHSAKSKRADVDIARTLVDEIENGRFDFESFLKGVWNTCKDEGLKLRQLGVVFENVNVTGLGASITYQPTIASLFSPMRILEDISALRHPPVKEILYGLEGLVQPGEMLLVLGRPGSGCTSLLKVLANQTRGFYKVEGNISYDGISPNYVQDHYRGDVTYLPEDDIHFPSLSVAQTLRVAITARTPHTRLSAHRSREDYIELVSTTLATIFGLREHLDTPVGDHTIRGISGGQKKRLSIAEVLASRGRVTCWDNATRGLDSSTSLEFAEALRIATDISGMSTVTSLYQASENIYNLFDKVCVLNAGRMVYFGPANAAKAYFENMGFEPANRQTTADFLVSVTDPLSRTPRAGYEARVPRSAAEFSEAFLSSPLGVANRASIDAYKNTVCVDQSRSEAYRESARMERATGIWHKPSSAYTISLPMQVQMIMTRRVQMILGYLAPHVILVMSFMIQAVIIGSVFLLMSEDTANYFSRGGVLFFACLAGALSAMAEIPALYSQRPILARHQKSALYHPFIDALALTVIDIPITIITETAFSIVLYFMTGLQKSAEQFFIFLLLVCIVTLLMKAFFRALAATFNAEPTAMAFSGVGILILTGYVGYTIPKPSMIGALRWLTYINPLKYGFESLMVNEFHTLNGTCSVVIPSGPGYENVSLINQACTTVGALPGEGFVDGNRFLDLAYGYTYSHLWMNVGISFVFWIAFVLWFLYATERKGEAEPGASVLVFKRGAKVIGAPGGPGDEEKSTSEKAEDVFTHHRAQEDESKSDPARPPPHDIFTWQNLSYDIPYQGGTRRLLDDVSGLVIPGKLTALMGESGAGKTTLLNVLAQRTDIGVVSGNRFVDGHALPADFQAQTGYAQQMDIHLATTTVREALIFSAELRQPQSVPRAEKLAYVESVIELCDMASYADAVVGTVGQGLSVEQRKRLTIGVELAAKPKLLLFLDEPTSGLDSQSAWAIMVFLRSLANKGQAILCTIHQPSAELFQVFDALLLLRTGGQTCYFGDLGHHARTLIDYFERNGARICKDGENPAEYMLDVIGAGATARSSLDWYSIWIDSPESKALTCELDAFHTAKSVTQPGTQTDIPDFMMPYLAQVKILLTRSLQSYYRDPTYLVGKWALNVVGGLFIGFTFFQADLSLQGLQNHIFSVFLATILSVPLSQQIHIPFINFRDIYEYRERASKMYSWYALMTSSILVELPVNIFGSNLFFVCWYWTIGYPNTSDRVGFMWFIYCIGFTVYYTTFSQAVAAASPDANIAGLLFSLLFLFVLVFNGVLQPLSVLTPFWHWMYHLSPFTYLISAMATNGLGGQAITCAAKELSHITPPSGQTCDAFLSPFVQFAGGYLTNPEASSDCTYCPRSTADSFLAGQNMFFSERWRNLGFLFAYIAFNVALVFLNMYVFRVKGISGIKASFTRKKAITTS